MVKLTGAQTGHKPSNSCHHFFHGRKLVLASFSLVHRLWCDAKEPTSPKYIVIDGNTTVQVLMPAGWQQVTVQINSADIL